MRTATDWRELCRFDDLLQARAVATSVAAMEFDVRLCAAADPAHEDDDAGRPPYVVEVVHTDWPDLAEVLDEIVDEQVEFDRMLACRPAINARQVRIVIVLTVTGTVELLLLLSICR